MGKSIASMKSKAVLLMLVIGGALLAYALFYSSSASTVPGWSPVNEPLNHAITALSEEQQHPPLSTEETAVSDVTASNSANHNSTAIANSSGTDSAVPDTADPPSLPAAPASAPAPAIELEQSSTNPRLIDLNHATQSQLETLPGIGPSKAKAIIAYRDQHHGFLSIKQLLDVKGIGPKVFERISSLVQISN